MKVTVDVDCTPEEARRFLGLPDLSPVHDAYVEKMKAAVTDGADPGNVRRHDEGLGADERGGHDHVEADARPDGEGAALSDTIFALSSGAPPAGDRGRPDQRAARRGGARGAGRAAAGAAGRDLPQIARRMANCSTRR